MTAGRRRQEAKVADQRRNQRPEKQEEKDEKQRQEKNWEEKGRRDPLASATWAAVLIWAGVVLLAENLGWLARIPWLGVWQLILIGAGVIVEVGVAIRLWVPEYRRPVAASVVWGLILIAIGLGGVVGWGVVWPLALIAIGLAILFGRAIGHR